MVDSLSANDVPACEFVYGGSIFAHQKIFSAKNLSKIACQAPSPLKMRITPLFPILMGKK
jgi:hypothetical protein